MSAQFQGHLVLVGLPGAGKSTVGRVVAKLLNRPFVDFDVEIERRAGMPVSAIFSATGEPSFRKMEVDLTQELASGSPMVLAPGGGWVTNPGMIDLLRPPSRLVHLRISPTEALRRLRRSRVVRPLLSVADPSAVLDGLWHSRSPLYSQADIEIDVEVIDSQRVTDLILALAHDSTPRLG